MIFSLADLARRPFGSGGGAVRSLIVAYFFLSWFLASPVCELSGESQPHFQEFLLFLFFGDQMLLEKAKSRHFPPVGVVRDAVSYPERGYSPAAKLD